MFRELNRAACPKLSQIIPRRNNRYYYFTEMMALAKQGGGWSLA